MENLQDSYRARGLRNQLVREIAKKGIRDNRILEAFRKVPRHFFFDPIFIEHAYEDKAFPIGEGQTISQPYTVAFQTELLNILPGNKILEIGTGSGYQACILLELGAKLYSIEYNKILYEKTARFLPKIGYKTKLFFGDGSKGILAHAPYDGILVTAGAPNVPTELINQLKIKGNLVIPVGDKRIQKMLKITKIGQNRLSKKEYDRFSFVPLLGQDGWK